MHDLVLFRHHILQAANPVRSLLLPLCFKVNFLHSLDSLYHPSHLLASQQQFLHPSHHAGELSGHTLPNPHRNSGDLSLSSTFPDLLQLLKTAPSENRCRSKTQKKDRKYIRHHVE